ncbi:hypothetical protein PAAG_04826 [Paracoccidioides lutzii Pb01]|uniref:Uncharacterized protein n=1 Tax=Paracoccidioides lutzii (strain ATCC MYA-826 / Pb01) TaxID=502779 RepID=C1H1P0_PARBA|nr:hypothetical protein PAAG_04826 [Paracoccidioides lutzii Pb01]EEH33777.2 hypothetical protein PAAG_04826 [Paracoccidioides lutzii Pb01]
MEDPKTLTVATIWKFDKDAAEDIRKLFTETANTGSGFCKYKPAENVFVVDNCDVTGSAPKLSNLVAKYIDDERANDMLKISRISRLGPLNTQSENHYADDTNAETKGTLIDIAQISDCTKVPFTIEYWQSETGTVGVFEKFPYAINEVSRLSGADVALEESDRRLRVSSYLTIQVKDALNRLLSLQTSLSFSITPHIAHVLNVSPGLEYHLTLPVYSELNSQAINRILVDPGRKEVGRLCRMLATVIVPVNRKNRERHFPVNIIEPPCPTIPTKGLSKLWANFKFRGLGNASNIPQFVCLTVQTAKPTQQSQLDNHSSHVAVQQVAIPVERHPFLTQEKVSRVNKWVAAGVEAGVVGVGVLEPNSILLPNPSAEPVLPSLPPGIKRRRAIVIDTKGHSSGPIETSKPHPLSEPDEANEVASAQQKLQLPANFNECADEQSEYYTSTRGLQETTSKLKLSPKPAAKRGSAQLIDMDETPEMPTATIPPMAYLQSILKPTQAGPESEDCRPGCSVEKGCTVHYTMNKQAGNNIRMCQGGMSNLEKKTKIAESWDVSDMSRAMTFDCRRPFAKSIQQKSECKTVQQAKEVEKCMATTNNFLRQIGLVLNGARSFPGSLSLEIQLGLILIHPAAIEAKYKEFIFNNRSWNVIFQPKNNLTAPSTIFTDRLTTSGADIEYIVDLLDGEGDSPCQIFSEAILSRRVCYEFHCSTKNNESLVVTVDESGTAVVNRSECILGSVSVHCAAHTWDMRGVVKGAIEYVRGDEEIDLAIQNLIAKLYIRPDKSELEIFTQNPEDGPLLVTNVFVKRSTRHGFHKHETRPLHINTAWKSSRKSSVEHPNPHSSSSENNNTLSGSCSRSRTSREIQGPILQITEVQNLLFGGHEYDKSTICALTENPEDMVEGHRLWYEVSIINLEIEKILRSNKYLELGDRNTSWTTFDLPASASRNPNKADSKVTGPPAAASQNLTGEESDNHTPSEISNHTVEISSKDVSEMFHAANKIVENIDGVGWANFGPASTAANMIDRAASASLAAPSLFSATMRVPTEIGRGRPGCLERLSSLNKMESASAVNGLPRTDVTESEFW